MCLTLQDFILEHYDNMPSYIMFVHGEQHSSPAVLATLQCCTCCPTACTHSFGRGRALPCVSPSPTVVRRPCRAALGAHAAPLPAALRLHWHLRPGLATAAHPCPVAGPAAHCRPGKLLAPASLAAPLAECPDLHTLSCMITTVLPLLPAGHGPSGRRAWHTSCESTISRTRL